MKKILVTGGMLTYVMLFNAGMTSAQNLPDIYASDFQSQTSEQSMRKEDNLENKITEIALRLGMNPDELREDIKSNKPKKEILKKHGISDKKVKNVLHKNKFLKNHQKK